MNRTRRYLIVNADDFGRSPGVNQGVIQAHEHGIVTSASLMVRWPAAVVAGEYARARPALSLGLHVDLGEWVYRGRRWVPVYEAVAGDDPAAIRGEVARQLVAFRQLVGRDPTHIDSHQHVHRDEPVHSMLVEIAQDLGVALRDNNPDVRYCGHFYGQTATGRPLKRAISVDGLIAILANLPPGVTELGCHPGLLSDFETVYREERSVEVRALCDPRVRAAITASAIQLCSFDASTQLTEHPP